jgi:hypothetical protein
MLRRLFLCLLLLPAPLALAQGDALSLNPATSVAPSPRTPAVGVDTPYRIVLLRKSLRNALSLPLVEGSTTYFTPARVRGKRADDTALDDPSDIELVKDAALHEAALKDGYRYLEALLIAQPVQYFRDRQGQVEYAAINGSDPCVASLLLLPSFYKRFEPVFGRGFRVVAPDQFTLFLFPAEGNTLDQFTRPLAEQYADSSYPVSLEVFEIGEKGVKVVGELPR